MFDVKRDRHNYGNLLSPPEGFTLDKAIGTTYSLDLYALLALPIAMIYSKSMEGEFTHNRYDVLHAIRECGDKIDLFCQKGNIKVPKNYNNMIAFMEDAVIEVELPKPNAAFHSKLWVLKFISDTETIYRLIVLSRNLTFNRSWDVSYYADGRPAKKQNTQSNKLSLFLSSIYEYTGRHVPKDFLSELSRVNFDLPEGFHDWDVFPIQNFTELRDTLSNPMPSVVCKEMLVVSPFLDLHFLTQLKRNSKRLSFLSRQEELDKAKASSLKGIDYYVINDAIADGENRIDTENEQPRFQNIHAKMFVCNYDDYTDWYLGSANATSPAVNSGVELLVKVSSEIRTKRLPAFKKYILGEDNQYFIPYVPIEIEVDEKEQELEDLLRVFMYELSLLKFKGHCVANQANDNYKVEVDLQCSELVSSEFMLDCRMIHHGEKSWKPIKLGVASKLEFENISLLNLSKYIVLRVQHKNETIDRKLLVVKLDVELPKERNDVIFNRIIDNQSKFYEYLQFVLDPGASTASVFIERNTSASEEAERLGSILGVGSSIYESLLLAASRTPHKLKEIDKIVTSIEKQNKAIVFDFMSMWKVFKEFMQ